MRCSQASESREEPLLGTASTVRDFLLVECAGPWGVEALRDSRLPEHVKQWLRTRKGIRPLLIRRGPSDSVRVFRAREGRLTSATLGDIGELPGLDLDRDLVPDAGRLFLVCTHGRHDACCAERGRPLWKAMHEAAPEETWQVSHIGGDRFAANVLVLPEGLYYGRLLPQDAARFVADHRAGQLDLDHLRGRCSLPFGAQAAEVFLRRELAETRTAPLRLACTGDSSATFEVDGALWQVDVVRRTTREVLTCKAVGASGGWTYELASITRVSDARH